MLATQPINRETLIEKIIAKEIIKRREAQTDEKLWCESFVYIVDKKGNKVKLKFNSIQKVIDETIQKCETKNIPARIIILKARQEGVSTYTQSKILARTINHKNRNALVVAHRDVSTKSIFEKSKYMYNNLPEDIKPLKKNSNAQELVFNTPTNYKGDKEGLNSKIRIQTAGSSAIGRSDTYHYAHLSEYAFWEGSDANSPEIQLTGISNAIPNVVGTLIIIESTAFGFNHFKELWDDAVKGKKDYIPLFFAWHVFEEYQMPIESEEERIRFIKSYNKYEKGIVKAYNLRPEQIKWYRWALKNNCDGKEDLMKQENPSSPEEAFLTTGRPVFDNQIIYAHISYLKLIYEKTSYKCGSFRYKWGNPETKDFIIDETIAWEDNKYGCIRIYEMPKPGYPYVIGGDTKGEGHDQYAATVINNITGNRVAVLEMQSDSSKPYTYQIYCLGKFYNTALVGIEINYNTAPIEELTRLKYRRQYIRRKFDSLTKTYENKLGWKTDGNTRPYIIDNEIDLIKENIELFNDINMLNECLTFVRDKNNRPDAMSGKHDDILISDMIAAEIRTQQTTKIAHKIIKPQNAIQKDLAKRARAQKCRKRKF